MQEMKPQTNVLDLLPKLKSMALADRAMFEKGMKAFVSYVQAYAKHECNLIFRIKGNSSRPDVPHCFSQITKVWWWCAKASASDF